MDERKKYNSYLIPRHGAQGVKVDVPPNRAGAAADSSFSGTGFAEIEIDPGSNNVSAAERALRFFSSVTPPEPLEQKTPDPIRRKFYDMRKLAVDRPFARDDSELFYKQAKFMDEFTDDYPDEAKFFMYSPFYQRMGYEQLRTYFSWRAKARNGEMPPISVSYVFLYVYELLSNIGVNSPGEGLGKLLAVWNTCLKFGPALENYMPGWFKDYHIYYDLPQSFTDFAKEHDMAGYFSMMFLFDADADTRFEIWNRISGYNVNGSKFYNDGNEQLFRDCFYAVLDSIGDLCMEANISMEDLFIYSSGRRAPWKPFKYAVFYQWLQQNDRKVEMPGQERYYCKNNRWSANMPIYFSTQKDFVGYIFKKTEACLRQAVDYKYKLTAAPKARLNTPLSELKVLGERGATLEGAIEKAVADFHRNTTRTIVTVDHANLERIRIEALGTQEKLIVPEERARGELGEESGELTGDSAVGRTALIELHGEWAGGGVVESAVLVEPIGEPGAESGGLEDQDGMADFGTAAGGGWAALKEALSAVEVEALSLVLRGDAGIKAFADEHGVMLEVLADGINEKAVDHIGDSILEVDDGMSVFDEYRENVAELVVG